MSYKTTVAPTEEVVSVADVKANSEIVTSDRDSLIEDIITAAREEAEQITGRAIGTQTVLLQLDDFPNTEATGARNGPVALPLPPFIEITSVQYVDEDGVLQTLSPDAYSVDNSGDMNAWLLPAYGTYWPATRKAALAVKVTFVAGYSRASCPKSIKHWIMAKAGSMYEYREADMEQAPSPVGFVADQIKTFEVPRF